MRSFAFPCRAMATTSQVRLQEVGRQENRAVSLAAPVAWPSSAWPTQDVQADGVSLAASPRPEAEKARRGRSRAGWKEGRPFPDRQPCLRTKGSLARRLAAGWRLRAAPAPEAGRRNSKAPSTRLQ